MAEHRLCRCAEGTASNRGRFLFLLSASSAMIHGVILHRQQEAVRCRRYDHDGHRQPGPDSLQRAGLFGSVHHGILRRAADAWTQAEKMAITGCSLSAANTRLRSISASAPCSTCGSRRKGRKARIPTALVRKLGGRRLIWPYTNDYSVAVILSLLKSNLC